MPTHPFTPTHRQQLITALLDAFASRDELDHLVWTAFERNPQEIIAERVNLTRAVEEVVEEAARSEGGVRRLLTVATQERIDNIALTQLAHAWQHVEFESVPKPSTTSGQTIQTEGGFVVLGDVNTGGDLIGRDKVTITEETAYNVQGLANPYLGLRSFEYKDQAIYGGREQLAQETVAALTDPKSLQSILFITGASGSGKSSFAQAGLIPLLEEHYSAYQKKVRYAIFRPSSQPMVMLADALQKLHRDLTPDTLTANTPKDQVNLLLIDQFEELFIQSEASQRAPFWDFLTNLPSFVDCRTHMLITLRVDYLDELFAIQPLWTIAKEGVELRTMSADDLRNAIQKPLQVHYPQKRFAPELLDRLVQDAAEDAALLPLLQVTLAELWKTGKLVLSNYHSLTNAIRQRAETVYAFSDHANADPKTPRSDADRQELMGILLDLINVSVDGSERRDVRQRRTRHELEQGAAKRSLLIEELINARLLTAASETRNGEDEEVIDVIHESLIDNWKRLRESIEEQRQQLQRRTRFKLWLGEWVRHGRQEGYLLLTDIQLAEAQVLMDSQDIEVQGVEALAFCRQSEAWRDTERQKELEKARIARNRALMALAALALAFVLALFIGWQQYNQNRKLQGARLLTEAEQLRKDLDVEDAIAKYRAAEEAAQKAGIDLGIDVSHAISDTYRDVATQWVQEGEQFAIKKDYRSRNAKFKAAFDLDPPSDTLLYVWIEGGEFTMGSDAQDSMAFDDEKPQHKVILKGYWIMRTEVTNAEYARCIIANVCTQPNNQRWNKPQFERQPVGDVDWDQASAYAAWVGGVLPTEAQWEIACRSRDKRIYPWGNSAPTPTQLNYYRSGLDTWTDVGSYPAGANGLYDMAGSVWEWIKDWSDQEYYKNSPLQLEDPQGPPNGQRHPVRGGSFGGDEYDVRCANRDYHGNPAGRYDPLGFRVVSLGL